MKNSTVRIGARAQQMLRELADEEKRPLQTILEAALEAYRRKRFLEQVNAAYAAERAAPTAGAFTLAQELATLDGTLMDGLDPAETWNDGGRVTSARRPARLRKK